MQARAWPSRRPWAPSGGRGAFPQPTAPNCIGSLLQKALQDPPASLPARALQKEAGEPPPTPFRPLPGKAGEATGNASPRRASQPRGQRTPNPRKAELGGSTTLPNLQGPAGRGPSRPQAGVQSPGCTSWGPGGHQARPSRKPSRGKGAWGGAPGRSWAGGRKRRARGAGGARRAPGSQPPTQPGPSQALSTGVRSPTPARGPPSPSPPELKPSSGSWQALQSFLGRPPPAPAFRKDCFPWHPREAEVAAVGPAAGPRRAEVWGGRGAGRQEGPQAPWGWGPQERGQRPFSKWAHLLCREPRQGRVPVRARGLQRVGQETRPAHGLHPGAQVAWTAAPLG